MLKSIYLSLPTGSSRSTRSSRFDSLFRVARCMRLATYLLKVQYKFQC
jgi:hypothetical protein